MRTRSVAWLLPGAIRPTYSRAPLSSRLDSTAKKESLASIPGGGNWWTFLANSAFVWSSARRMVAVDATIFGRRSGTGSRAVDGRFVQTGQRAERTGDQVEFVLDDQFRRRGSGEIQVEELMRLVPPGDRRELVGGRDDQRRMNVVDVVVDDDTGSPCRKAQPSRGQAITSASALAG